MVKHTVKWVTRNLIGYALFLAGVVMLITPGQGLLTMLAGMAIADWPGRHRFFTWLRTYPRIEQLDEWIERKFKVRLPGDPPAPSKRSDHHGGQPLELPENNGMHR